MKAVHARMLRRTGQSMVDHMIEIYRHPNPQMMSFLTREELFPPCVAVFKNPLNGETRRQLKTLGEIPSRIVTDILSVPGIEEIYIKPKEVRVKKQADVSWENIQGRILEVVRRSLRRKEIRVVE